VRKIWDQLTAAGHEVKEGDVLLSMLAGLPPSYDSLVNVLETSNGTLSLADVVSKLLVVEQRITRQEADDSHPAETALYTCVDRAPKPDHKSKVKCFECGKRGHYKRECPERKANVLSALCL
jgi:hypothetical protein